MKTNLLLIGIVVIRIAIFYMSKSPKTESSVKASVRPQTPQPGGKLIDQVRNFPGLQTAKLSVAEQSSECKSALESFEILPITTLIQDIQSGRTKIKGEYLFTSKNTMASLSGIPEMCDARQSDGHATQDCVTKVLFYKALRFHHLTG